MISLVSKRKEYGLQEDCNYPVIYNLVGSFLLFPESALLILQSRGKGFVHTPKGAHLLADLMCDKPEECKCDVDTCFEFLRDIPQDVWDFVANMTASSTVQTSPVDRETAQKHRRATIHAATYQKNKVGNSTKAEDVIKSLRFSSYEENNLCDLKEGIPEVEFDATVEEIVVLTNMPAKLESVVKRARNFTRGNLLAVDRLQFKTKDGNMVFGRTAVLRKGDTLDMAYSLHSVKYELKKRQNKRENAANFPEVFRDS